MSSKFTNRRLEFHILQSFPVSCLNRDDLGSPKSALIGGVTRARVSSQCWKRAVRMELRNLGVNIAKRTKLVAAIIAEKCLELGATESQANECGLLVAKALNEQDPKSQERAKKEEDIKKLANSGDSKNMAVATLFFISDTEANKIAELCKENAFEFKKITRSKVRNICEKISESPYDGLDIALFGRMAAQFPSMNVEAAASFAHAISIHKVTSELDYFAAVDDCRAEDEAGAGHIDNLEFNSATYYRYISLDLGQLAKTLKTDDLADAVKAFTTALFLAVPSARQTTMAAATPWDYAIVTLRHGQRLQLPFNTPVKNSPALVADGVAEMKKRYELTKELYGTLFGEELKVEFGEGHETFDGMLKLILDKIQA